ncbi:MAG: SDR family NAD(P)-dependent oxidoreductase [Spirochaetota bacterium]
MNEHLRSIVPAIRGALLRFLPAATLVAVSDEAEELIRSRTDAQPHASSGEPLEVAAGEQAPEGAELVAAIESYREANGTLPRLIRVTRGPLFAVGASLSPAAERLGETMLTADQCAGRDGVVRGRVAVVTGGAQGFGEEIVRSLVAHGARVVIADLNREGAKALSDELNAAHGPVTGAVGVDVSDEDSVAQMVDELIRTAGGIDLFVSNAGVLRAGSVQELSAKDFEFVTRVNYTAFFLCTKHVSRLMSSQAAAAPLDRYTDIVQINSKSGLAGSNRNGAYAGSKFGGLGLVQSFALELVKDRIKVNAICPGNFFEGPLWSDPDRGLFVQYLNAGKVPGATSVAEVKAHYEKQVPMGRGCRGDDVVRALLYVVEQRYETGQAVPVTGGQNMLS